MTQPQPDKLDQLLTRHLLATLEPQVGRAAEAFRRQIQATGTQAGAGAAAAVEVQLAPAPAPIPFAQPRAAGVRTIATSPYGSLIPRRALWYWAGVPSALAACLAVVLMLQFFNGSQPGPRRVNDPVPNGTVSFNTPQLNQYETSRDINGGIAVLNDDTPVRVFHREGMRETQWVDPEDHATYSVTEPVEKVGYIRVQPY